MFLSIKICSLHLMNSVRMFSAALLAKPVRDAVYVETFDSKQDESSLSKFLVVCFVIDGLLFEHNLNFYRFLKVCDSVHLFF